MQILGNLTKNLIASDEHDAQINISLPLVLAANSTNYKKPQRALSALKASLDA